MCFYLTFSLFPDPTPIFSAASLAPLPFIFPYLTALFTALSPFLLSPIPEMNNFPPSSLPLLSSYATAMPFPVQHLLYGLLGGNELVGFIS